MDNKEIIKSLDTLINFFNEFNAVLDKREEAIQQEIKQPVNA